MTVKQVARVQARAGEKQDAYCTGKKLLDFLSFFPSSFHLLYLLFISSFRSFFVPSFFCFSFSPSHLSSIYLPIILNVSRT